MYLIERFSGERAQVVAQDRLPFGGGFDSETVSRLARLELWGSSFTDLGDDFCEYRLFDADGRQIATKRVGGY